MEAGGAGFSPEADLAVGASWTVPSGVAGARGARAWVAPPSDPEGFQEHGRLGEEESSFQSVPLGACSGRRPRGERWAGREPDALRSRAVFQEGSFQEVFRKEEGGTSPSPQAQSFPILPVSAGGRVLSRLEKRPLVSPLTAFFSSQPPLCHRQPVSSRRTQECCSPTKVTPDFLWGPPACGGRLSQSLSLPPDRQVSVCGSPAGSLCPHPGAGPMAGALRVLSEWRKASF